MSNRSKAACYSITSSAIARSDGGTVETKHAGGLRVVDQLELGRLLDRQVSRLSALEDAATYTAIWRYVSTILVP